MRESHLTFLAFGVSRGCWTDAWEGSEREKLIPASRPEFHSQSSRRMLYAIVLLILHRRPVWILYFDYCYSRKQKKSLWPVSECSGLLENAHCLMWAIIQRCNYLPHGLHTKGVEIRDRLIFRKSITRIPMLTNLVVIRKIYEAMQRDGRWETNDACAVLKAVSTCQIKTMVETILVRQALRCIGVVPFPIQTGALHAVDWLRVEDLQAIQSHEHFWWALLAILSSHPRCLYPSEDLLGGCYGKGLDARSLCLVSFLHHWRYHPARWRNETQPVR